LIAIALEEAKKGDAPYGAVIVRDNEIALVAHPIENLKFPKIPLPPILHQGKIR